MRTREMLGALVIVALGVTGCGAANSGVEDEDGPIGVALQRELDPGMYTISQSGLDAIAASWIGADVTGAPIEYWAKKTGYQATASRSYAGTSASCATFRQTVCGAGWAGATYYQASVVEEALDCANRPGAVTPPPGASSFLGSGSYRVKDPLGASFAWTYVSGGVEYWAMKRFLDTGSVSTQSPQTPVYGGVEGFVDAMCALRSRPTIWVTASYAPVPSFCSVDPC